MSHHNLSIPLGRHRRAIILAAALAAVIILAAFTIYNVWLRPTKILVVNALPAQAAELRVNNDSRRIDVACRAMDDPRLDFAGYDAIVMYGRGLFLDSLAMLSLQRAAERGTPIFTNTLRNFSFVENHNLDSAAISTLNRYIKNPCGANYRNLLRFIRATATPRLLGDNTFEPPIDLPSGMFYHREAGQYFTTADELREYLRNAGLYREGAPAVAFISGVTFPVEGSRAHVDTLIDRITAAGYNVFPLSASGSERAEMILSVDPAAVVYLPMGRLGNDALIDTLQRRGIPLFMPFPLIQSREEWLDVDRPLGGGTLNARIVVPEIDGAMTPLCIATQDTLPSGGITYKTEPERIDAFMGQFTRFMDLRTKPNAEKRIAIAYFKSPGKDALLASGMEVVPSMYNFLLRLRREGYDVGSLPSSPEVLGRLLAEQGMIAGSYAPAAQQRFMDEASPIWLSRSEYEEMARAVLTPEKYREVEERYGPAPGSLLARGDSLAFAALRFGNILIFPQPRPALGDDDFKLVHGADVPPPHSYIAPYAYMQRAFDADAIIHFGTHGNLEFTPGKNAGLSAADWAEALIGPRPHFYFYTTGNVGEAIIAKRRSHAVIVSHLTPPFVESGMRQRYNDIIDELHHAIADPSKNTLTLRRRIIALGLHRDLGLDSTAYQPFTPDELRRIDSFVEEIANEKITGAYYVMGRPYDARDMASTIQAIAADKIAYERARRDRDAGLIADSALHDHAFISHHYLPDARRDIARALASGRAEDDAAEALNLRRLLTDAPADELNAMVGLLSGRPVAPAPGGDPVLNPNVLPTGRNMYSINAEATPSPKAWEDGVALAENTIAAYRAAHGGEFPRKVSYTFWAGEFIASQGATIAQALRMLGVEPVRDGQGRVMDLRLIPSAELGRPRINILVQVSGQLRDIAGSRLKMITDAVALASDAKDDVYPNFVAEGTIDQERRMVAEGTSPARARELARMRVFGPLNSGYSTGMLRFTESSGRWDDPQELVDGFLNNMSAMYGDDDNWGASEPRLFASAIADNDIIVQPRQSNTWGPLSLDHVYEFTGALSLASTAINGREPDAVMADYRNSYLPRIQSTREAVAVETRAAVLNPTFIRERMKGDATTAQMFGEIFRNIFGWSATRPSALDEDIYDELFDLYIADKEGLGIEEYFLRVNPAALQEMTATMMESARKGYWQPAPEQLKAVAEMHARVTDRAGAPCTEFVCDNARLQQFIARALDPAAADTYLRHIAEATASSADNGQVVVLRDQTLSSGSKTEGTDFTIIALSGVLAILLIIGFVIIRRRKRSS